MNLGTYIGILLLRAADAQAGRLSRLEAPLTSPARPDPPRQQRAAPARIPREGTVARRVFEVIAAEPVHGAGLRDIAHGARVGLDSASGHVSTLMRSGLIATIPDTKPRRYRLT